MQTFKTLRIIFREMNGEKMIAETLNKQVIGVILNSIQLQEMNDLSPALSSGVIFHLLNANEITDNTYQTEFLIFEPDYLIDTSALAECFRPYGNHFLNYTLSRLQHKEITPSILLGNTANFFIDELVNADENYPLEFTAALKKLFRTYAFELTVCRDLKDSQTETGFFENCRKHFNHIRHAINRFFPKAGIEKEKIVLEPSFISNALGLQGRLDIMLCDYSAFIELKSGKATEDFRTGGQFIHAAENHYVQMILYLAILEFNLDLQADNVRSYLLYSKYSVLSKERHSRQKLQEALSLRNAIVAREYALQKANDPTVTYDLLNKINSCNLNTKSLSGNLFTNYLAPVIDRFSIGFSCLKEHEKAYFLRIYTFIVKELWLSKAGEREYEGIKKASVLWNASFEDKLIAGEILYDLRIIENHAASESHTVTLEIPVYPDLYLPTFRPGDAIVLYERNAVSDTVNNRQVFRGAIERLERNLLIVRLRYRQKNPHVWNQDACYAVEHDYMDTNFAGMFRALTCFLEANQDRKDLLTAPGSLSCRHPALDGFPDKSHGIAGQARNDNRVQGIAGQARNDSEVQRIADHVRNDKQNDLFLLLGPPGSGKTSIALKQMVEIEIMNKQGIAGHARNDSGVQGIVGQARNDSGVQGIAGQARNDNGVQEIAGQARNDVPHKTNVLLLAYTNRAVDEICKALTGISVSLPFIRIGSELNCNPEFRNYLLENYLNNCQKRSEVLEVIQRCRIFVGTVASVWNKPELFQLKHFDLAIIDEATQLLEPHLLGIFCVKNETGENAVDRFVLIGDHKQLPAVVLQSKEESRVNDPLLNAAGITDLSASLFERFYRKYSVEGNTSALDMLSKQGRMHPVIAAFPSEQFYEGRLESAGLPHQTEEWPDHNRIRFYPVEPLHREFSDKINRKEADTVTEICKELYVKHLEKGEGLNPQSIGIIAPFRNQIALIRKQLQETGIPELSEITVDTVERFQGSQRDVIIYSFCIKTEEQLKFLPNWLEENGNRIDRKLNVALTRARKQLHVIGNEKLLKKNPVYKKLIEYIREQMK